MTVIQEPSAEGEFVIKEFLIVERSNWLQWYADISRVSMLMQPLPTKITSSLITQITTSAPKDGCTPRREEDNLLDIVTRGKFCPEC